MVAVLRHDFELAKVEDRIEDAINLEKALEAIGAPPEWRGERAAGQLLSWGGAAFDLGVGPLAHRMH